MATPLKVLENHYNNENAQYEQTIVPGVINACNIFEIKTNDEQFMDCSSRMNVLRGKINNLMDDIFYLNKKDNYEKSYARAESVYSFLKSLKYIRDYSHDEGRIVFYTSKMKRTIRQKMYLKTLLNVKKDFRKILEEKHFVNKEVMNIEYLV